MSVLRVSLILTVAVTTLLRFFGSSTVRPERRGAWGPRAGDRVNYWPPMASISSVIPLSWC